MSRLIFVRHSVPKIIPGTHPSKWHLSSEGFELARLLAKRLEYLAPDVVYSSKEPKAQETGRELAQHLGISLLTEKDIREHELSSRRYLGQSEFDAAVCKFFNFPNQRIFGKKAPIKLYNDLWGLWTN